MPRTPPAPILRSPDATPNFHAASRPQRPAARAGQPAPAAGLSTIAMAVTAAAFCTVGILAWMAAIGVAVLAVTGEHGMHHAIAQYAGILQRLTIG